MKLAWAVLLLALFDAPTTEVQFVTQKAVVTKIENGHKIHLRFNGINKEFQALLKGVNTYVKKEECFAEEATCFLAERILDKEVTVDWDSGEKTAKDSFLVYISLDGKDINAEVVSKGYGWVPMSYWADRKKEYLKIEKKAREAKLGLWSCFEK